MKAASRTTTTLSSGNLGQTRIDELLQSSNKLAKLSIASQDLSQCSLHNNENNYDSQEIRSMDNLSSVMPCIITQDEEPNYCTPQDQAILHNSSCPPSSPAPRKVLKSCFYYSQSTQDSATQHSQLSDVPIRNMYPSQDSAFSSQTGMFWNINGKCNIGQGDKQIEMRKKRTRKVEKQQEPLTCIYNPYFEVLNDNTLERTRTKQQHSLRNSVIERDSDTSSRYWQDFEEIAVLGRGERGVVVKARHRIDGGIYAIKMSRKPLVGNSCQHEALREVQILVALGGHPNITQYFNSWLENETIYIQLEYCSGGSLSTLMNDIIPSIDELFRIMRNITSALCFIHSKGIVHMDVKPENVLISKGVHKLGDFGLACLSDRSDFIEQEGDKRYLCRSMLDPTTADFKSADIFALGATMLEIATGKSLPTSGEEWQKIRNNDVDQGFLQQRCGSRLSALIRWCLASDPMKRPTAEELLQRFEPKIERVFEMEQLLIQQKAFQETLQQKLALKDERIQRLEAALKEICVEEEG
ncbi:Wee1-like protein kinase putative tyrosine kinase Wee1 [Galdieria sulphuraria]|uniref:Wee1-like protein kinase putative tyrosine kinase Wee1 n=1 Tax=Galdieria sulphuraria TaxID=130081 RepID=M2XMH3_GALSU|nr:Wee1-like protein kinase putative tyrosine kinase Wee1 [Galdieria sulphuraria]EME31362.1 Wee1-like protein kinase putative tyrosine kinase Wee1 [Galdieria sulphuraria]|eukprot:XP_005707882.1 Wee1-like protein kinase putative tyrosine kinase Wee1 [Galdieria sulphuraria]